MRTIVYRFVSRGMYLTTDDTAFGEEERLLLTVEPHDFSLAVGGEVLRRSSCGGYQITVSRDGEAVFCDSEGSELCRAEKGDRVYRQVRLEWKQDQLCVLFGSMETVDYYPNCDGESDRWGEEWVTHRRVTLELTDGSVTVQ